MKKLRQLGELELKLLYVLHYQIGKDQGDPSLCLHYQTLTIAPGFPHHKHGKSCFLSIIALCMENVGQPLS